MADILLLRSPASRKSRRLRIAGALVLVLGLVGAALLYWIGTRAPNLMDDPSMAGFDKAERRQMGELFGNDMGIVTKQLFDSLRQPGTQAKLLAALSVLVSAGCFWLARLTDQEAAEEADD